MDGNPDQAEVYLRQALAIYERIGSRNAQRGRKPCITSAAEGWRTRSATKIRSGDS